ncbi:MAG TPA: hypothetical protein P5186_09395 [Candidatus Paceibacterota bacterium]|nr:hypothetical protein [Verrucomicrobiota bacterium]HRY48249.1 hypothetical protein [Candidatus Paceibacterota bacterium]HSA03265.1 hypothetical protein [Candidatus Paceibacterota bacterium]
MNSGRIAGIILLTAALHIVVLSVVFGFRHVGYMGAATFSGTLIWGGCFFLNEGNRPAGFAAGIVVGLAVQQVVYQAWRVELPGFWWSLILFLALHVLVAFGLGRIAP